MQAPRIRVTRCEHRLHVISCRLMQASHHLTTDEQVKKRRLKNVVVIGYFVKDAR
jgi:hypothetical protein